MGYDPVVMRRGMGAKARTATIARLQPQPDGRPPLVVATGPGLRQLAPECAPPEKHAADATEPGS